MIEMDEYYKDYTKDISGWETLVDEIRDENRFDTELFLKIYPEAFELLKPYFMEKMLPKFIARLLSKER